MHSTIHHTTKPPHTMSIKGVVTRSAIVASAVALLVAPLQPVYGDRYDDQIKAIEREVSGYQEQANVLGQRSDSLQNEINTLNAQIATIQAQVNLSQAKFEQLQAKIAENETKLAQLNSTLDQVIGQLYVNNKTTTLEVLAGSSTIGEFANKQEYRSTVKRKAIDAIKQVKKIKSELARQQTEVKQVLADQQSQRDTVAAKRAEQAKLLADTQGQESAYQQLIGAKNSQISGLRAQQAAANAAAARQYSVSNLQSGGAGCGGYPALWCNSSIDTIVDDWGMYNRECVSYTAWRVSASGRHMPYWGGRGNANEWPSSAQADGIPTGGTPRAGAVAIMYTGPYGHSMYVDSVNGDGTINVSQFNWGLRGEFSTMRISGSGLTYIYF